MLRSCTMTLVVLAEAGEDAAALGETLAALMPEHPARAISIRLRGAGDERSRGAGLFAVLEAVRTAPADLLRADGDHRLGCGLADLRPVVLPLAVPDLPLILVPQPALGGHAGVRRNRGHGREGGAR